MYCQSAWIPQITKLCSFSVQILSLANNVFIDDVCLTKSVLALKGGKRVCLKSNAADKNVICTTAACIEIWKIREKNQETMFYITNL